MTPIYHITHYSNMSKIIEEGALWCDAHCKEHQVQATSISHEHIKERRARRQVKKAAQGTLADYVPFYFAPRSPMLYAIHTNSIQVYKSGQTEIVHLVASVETAIRTGLPWCFTEGHAEIEYSEFFDDLEDMDKIDWEIMNARYWAESDETKRRRQAEFLVHQVFPFEGFGEIAVHNSRIEKEIRKITENHAWQPTVTIKPCWYY